MQSFNSTRCLLENMTKSISVPTKLPETSKKLTDTASYSHHQLSQSVWCSDTLIEEENVSDEDISSYPSTTLLQSPNGNLVEDYFLPIPRKKKHSLKRYLLIFLVMISLLIVTLLVLCSQVTLPGRGSNLPKQQTSHVSSGSRKLPSGKLIHYVGSKFMAPAVQKPITEHVEAFEAKLAEKNKGI